MNTITFVVNGDRVGGAFFYATPIANRTAFHCVPADLLTYAELESVSQQLARGVRAGQIRKYQWSLSERL